MAECSTAGLVLNKETLESHAAVETLQVSRCCSVAEYFALKQLVGVVRHGDRLDQTPEWLNYADRGRYPADGPLTDLGRTHSQEAGRALSDASQKKGIPFGLVVSSPYLRCAQTASEIARVLGVPVQFDLDLGEVFGSDMEGADGSPKHRCPDELESALQVDYQDVKYLRDDCGKLQIRGKQPNYPESTESARLRFCFKVQELVRQAALKLSSIVIVTHADALASVTRLLMPSSVLTRIPYAGHIIASRSVKVFDARSNREMTQEPVYRKHVEWTVDVGPGFEMAESERYAEQARSNRHQLKESGYKLTSMQSTNSLGELSKATTTTTTTTSSLSPKSSGSSRIPSTKESVKDVFGRGIDRHEAQMLVRMATCEQVDHD